MAPVQTAAKKERKIERKKEKKLFGVKNYLCKYLEGNKYKKEIRMSTEFGNLIFFLFLWSRAENIKKARGIFFPEEVISKIPWSLVLYMCLDKVIFTYFVSLFCFVFRSFANG